MASDTWRVPEVSPAVDDIPEDGAPSPEHGAFPGACADAEEDYERTGRSQGARNAGMRCDERFAACARARAERRAVPF